MILKITIIVLFCFFNTVRASSSRKLGREQKKKGSTFRAITRLETLATQSTASFQNEEFELSTSPFIMGLSIQEPRKRDHINLSKILKLGFLWGHY